MPPRERVRKANLQKRKQVGTVAAGNCPYRKRQDWVHYPTFASLIVMAIYASPKRQLTLKQIYKFVDIHRGLVASGRHVNWKNSVRHNLSLHDYFCKMDRKRKYGKVLDSLWTLKMKLLPKPALEVVGVVDDMRSSGQLRFPVQLDQLNAAHARFSGRTAPPDSPRAEATGRPVPIAATGRSRMAAGPKIVAPATPLLEDGAGRKRPRAPSPDRSVDVDVESCHTTVPKCACVDNLYSDRPTAGLSLLLEAAMLSTDT